MPKSSSSSSQTQTTQTTNQDQRVAAEPGGIAVGAGTTLTIAEDFSENVKEAFFDLVDLAREAGSAAIDFSKTAIEANEKAVDTIAVKALDKVSERAKQAEDSETLGEKKILTDLAPFVTVAVIALSIAFIVKRK